MKKNVKNWDLDWDLFEMGRMVKLVEYQVSKNNWGKEWLSLGEWLKSCGYSSCLSKLIYRLWVINNRLVRDNIGVYNEEVNEFVSGLCMLKKGGVNM